MSLDRQISTPLWPSLTVTPTWANAAQSDMLMSILVLPVRGPVLLVKCCQWTLADGNHTGIPECVPVIESTRTMSWICHSSHGESRVKASFSYQRWDKARPWMEIIKVQAWGRDPTLTWPVHFQSALHKHSALHLYPNTPYALLPLNFCSHCSFCFPLFLKII